MRGFNKNSRRKNMFLASGVGVATDAIKVLMGFGYRTLFLYCLSVDYLGINGLFSNVLQVLSLADLGISTAIVYRFYAPISNNDIEKVGQLMNFFGRIYRVIAIAILGFGMMLMPFLHCVINEADKVPADINIYVIFLLFLTQTVSSYIFVYKITILSADQKNHVVNIINFISVFFSYVLQISVLILTKDYTMTLAVGIMSNLAVNYASSVWAEKQYKEVFSVESMLPYIERKQIFDDVKALMYHRVGTVVLTGTDSLVLTRMVSLAATGLYSNYAMIIMNLQNLFGKLFGNYVSSIGNAKINLSHKEYYELYLNINLLNSFVACFFTVGVYTCIDDFIKIWLGNEFVLGPVMSAWLALQFYMSISGITNGVYTNASGLFVKDRYRPLIESFLNLSVSIFLAARYGIVGVIAGTVISNMLTVGWRVPYILYKYDFYEESVYDYWKINLSFLMYAVIISAGILFLKYHMMVDNMSITIWVLEGGVSMLLTIFITGYGHWRNRYLQMELHKLKLILTKKINR